MRKTIFHSGKSFDLEEGGHAGVEVRVTEAEGIRYNVYMTPGAQLTDRDAGILAGLLLGAAFAPPHKAPPILLVEPKPEDDAGLAAVVGKAAASLGWLVPEMEEQVRESEEGQTQA